MVGYGDGEGDVYGYGDGEGDGGQASVDIDDQINHDPSQIQQLAQSSPLAQSPQANGHAQNDTCSYEQSNDDVGKLLTNSDLDKIMAYGNCMARACARMLPGYFGDQNKYNEFKKDLCDEIQQVANWTDEDWEKILGRFLA